MRRGSRNHLTERIAKARELRREMSVSEKVLWQFLRKDRLGFRFRRHLTVGPWILDFYCAEAKLCVEVDGEQHLERKEKDLERDIDLLRRDILTLRIPSVQLFTSNGKGLEEALDQVLQACYKRTNRPEHERVVISELLLE